MNNDPIRENWPVDGRFHSVLEKNAIYINHEIEEFLDDINKTFLIATKGMGKTLLLRIKKNQLEISNKNNHNGHLIIPRDHEFDFPSLNGSYSKKGLESIKIWQEIWNISIILSIITYSPRKKDFIEEFNYEIKTVKIPSSFIKRIKSIFSKSQKFEPSFFLNEILLFKIGSIQKIITFFNSIEYLSRKYIENSVCVFIDGLDHALATAFSHNIEIWKNAQNGLLIAAHKIRVSNSHIKIFLSIRQEAWSDFFSEDRKVIKGESFIIKYEKNELKKILEHAIKKYSHEKSINDFIGLDSIENSILNTDEDPFNYLCRHSVYTPRSMIGFGSLLASKNIKNTFSQKSEKEKYFKLLINSSGCDQVYNDYFLSERRVLLDTLNNKEKIEGIIRLIPSNVLRGKTLYSISKEFKKTFDLDDDAHPFCELFNIGILGEVKEYGCDKKITQHFKKPYEFDWKKHNIINERRTYIVHPGLYDVIDNQRDNKFYINTSNLVGDNYEWNNTETIFPSIFISHSSDDKKLINKILPEIENRINLNIPIQIWYDEKNIQIGESILKSVELGIQSSTLLLLFISKSSLSSKWVEEEWRKKYLDEIHSGGIKVICCLLDEILEEQVPKTLINKNMFKFDQKQSQHSIKLLSDKIASLLRDKVKPRE